MPVRPRPHPFPDPSPCPGRGQAAWRLRLFCNRRDARVRAAATYDHYLSSATHSDSSGLARSLALSVSRVAAARRTPVLPYVLQRDSGFLARARHARGNDRTIRPSGRACHYLVQRLNRLKWLSMLIFFSSWPIFPVEQTPSGCWEFMTQ